MGNSKLIGEKLAIEYFNNGGNATKAYQTISPDSEYVTARNKGHLITKTNGYFKRKLKELMDRESESALESKAQVINKFREIREKAIKNKSYQAANVSNKEIGVLSDVYDRDDNESTKWQTFIGQFTVQVNQTPQYLEQDAQDVVVEDVDTGENQGYEI